jgi:fructose-1-phosphate kinase PfkB-like protein
MAEGTPILCGPDNIKHMQTEHPAHFEKYGSKIDEIIASPDYICKHPKKDSIEYVKVFKNDNNEHVLVAVRASGSGVLFARTLFVMDPKKVQAYQSKNAFKPY